MCSWDINGFLYSSIQNLYSEDLYEQDNDDIQWGQFGSKESLDMSIPLNFECMMIFIWSICCDFRKWLMWSTAALSKFKQQWLWKHCSRKVQICGVKHCDRKSSELPLPSFDAASAVVWTWALLGLVASIFWFGLLFVSDFFANDRQLWWASCSCPLRSFSCPLSNSDSLSQAILFQIHMTIKLLCRDNSAKS